MDALALRKLCEMRLNGLRQARQSWWVHWRELATYILPRRYRWLMTPNEAARGLPLNQNIIDSTGTIAARTLAAGMMSGITSPSRPWFKLKIDGVESDESNPATIWLAEVERRMMRVFSESNFYNSMAVAYFDLAVFGTAAQLIYEDFDNVIQCYNPCLGEFYVGLNDRLQIDTFYREFPQTIHQLIQWFGLERLSPQVRNLATGNNPQLSTEIIICHAIEPNEPKVSGISTKFAYRELYWERGSSDDTYLQLKGYYEKPSLVSRWDVCSNDAYGRSPGMDALGDIKQLQQEQKRKAQAIDKMVNPPLIADITLKNQPASTLPGGITYATNISQGGVGMKPIYTVMPPVREMMEDIKEVQARIRSIFFNDIFMMFQDLQAEPRSAAAVDARREEKLVMLGPVLERFENEVLDPAIDRVFNIMNRAGLLPPPPAEIQGENVQVQYVSMLAESQRAAATGGIERLLALAGNVAAIKPDAMDKIDVDEIIDIYASYLAVPPKAVRPDDAVEAIREQRAKQEQAQAGAALTMEGVNAAKTLSETEVGGGINALQMMMGAE